MPLFILAVFLIVVGIPSFFPKEKYIKVLMWGRGWRFKDKDVFADDYVMLNKIIGFILFVIGIILILVWFATQS